MTPLVEFARGYGLLVGFGVVLATATFARVLLVAVRAVVRGATQWARERSARSRLGRPAAPTFVSEDEGRSVTLDGTFVAEGPHLKVGSTPVRLHGAAEGDEVPDGTRVLARGTLRRTAGEAGAMFRDAAPPSWVLEPTGARREVATILPYRPRGGAGVVAFLAGAATGLAGLTTVAGGAMHALHPRVFVFTGSDRSSVAWQTRWDPRDERALAASLCSPWHRRRALQQLKADPNREALWAMSSERVRATGSALHDRGLCARATDLYLTAGLLREAGSEGVSCPDARARSQAWDARSAMGWLHGDAREVGLRQSTLDHWLRDRTPDLQGDEVFALVGSVRDPDGPRVAFLSSSESDPTRASLHCIEFALRHIHTRDRWDNDPPPASAWDAMLRSDAPACRIIAATRSTRRDDASLRALDEIAPSASPVWRPLLDAARSLIVLDGGRSGSLQNVSPCERQEPYGTIDPARYARMPMVTAELVQAAASSPCRWMVDHVRLPAQEALLRFVLETGGTGAGYFPYNACSIGSGLNPLTCMGFGPEWYLWAWHGYQGALLSQRENARRDPRFDARWEASLRAGLLRVLGYGPVLAAREQTRSWSIDDYRLGRRAHPPSLTGMITKMVQRLGHPDASFWRVPPQRAATELEQRASELSAPVAAAVRSGDGITAAERVRVLQQGPESDGASGLRARAFTAARTGDTLAVIASLGPPTADAVRAFADVASLLSTRREAAIPWLRVAASYAASGATSLYERARLGEAIGRALSELRPNREEMPDTGDLYFFSHASWDFPDAFILAVVEALREDARDRVGATAATR